MRSKPNRRNRQLSKNEEELSVPMLEIFAGAFALMLVLFVLMNVIQSTGSFQSAGDLDEGEYKIVWSTDAEGFVVVAYPHRLWIIETQTAVKTDGICQPDSPFIAYAKEKYTAMRKQIVFAILDDALKTTSIARNCLRKIFPNQPTSIGWIIANKELLNAVNLAEIPDYVGDFAK